VGRAQVWLKQSIPAPALPAGPQGTIVKAESTLVADQRPTGAACPPGLNYVAPIPLLAIQQLIKRNYALLTPLPVNDRLIREEAGKRTALGSRQPGAVYAPARASSVPGSTRGRHTACARRCDNLGRHSRKCTACPLASPAHAQWQV
jgi:hypothetical protein